MSQIKKQYEFLAGLYSKGETYFNRYALTIEFYNVESTPEDQDIALDRIAYFLYDAVSRSVFIHEDEVTQIDAFTKAGIPVLTISDPGPTDPAVLGTLVTKMNAITEDIIVISDAEIISELSGSLIYAWDSAYEDELHTRINNSDETRWWVSPDPRFGSYPDGVDVADVETTQPFPLTWQMLDLSWHCDTPEVETVISKSVGKNHGTVIKADFTSADPKKK